LSNQNEVWIDEAILGHQRLTLSAVAIIKGLLTAKGIAFLAVDGRTKDRDGIKKKVERKNYNNPRKQMTDISGVRVIVYFESDIIRVSEVISTCFRVDKKNSLDKGALLEVDKIGYRSVHYVCDIGAERGGLPEFEGMAGLKFEVQVRTVLQHAWAEISHDRNYKFSGALPAEMQRELFLYSGLLEVADKGFDKLSTAIDLYVQEIKHSDSFADSPIDSISLTSFVESWCDRNDLTLRFHESKSGYSDLVDELRSFGIKTLVDLSGAVPEDYADNCREIDERTTVYGHVRNWMLIKDWRKYHAKVKYGWELSQRLGVLKYYFSGDELVDFMKCFRPGD
jgi:putative GTP pyrophosphokinase